MDRMGDKDLARTATAPDDEDDGNASSSSKLQSETLARGTSIGRYLVLDTIGVGGTGIVYSAFDPDLDRKVALKLLRKSYGRAARARLLREAQAMAKLSHPNVVTVFEAGTDGQRDFVVMEYVDGEDLARWSTGSRAANEVIDVYRQAGEGLAAAHRAGLVHRDFKPSNALIDKSGRVLVTDFGLARQEVLDADEAEEGRSSSSSTLTRTGALMGTPAYMAPEQHLAQEADARSDQFSFCVALHEALCGERPFSGESYEELRDAVTEGEPTSLPDEIDVPASVRAALTQGMARKPDDRHTSMEALLERLSPAPRRLAPLVLLGFALLIAIAVAGLLLASPKEAQRCDFDRSMLAGAWDDDVRDTIRGAFTRTGVEGASEVAARLESILDEYADAIVDMRIQVCESVDARRGEGDEILVLRTGCLQRRRQDLSAMTMAFSSVDLSGVDRAIEAAHGLPPVDGCGDVQALQRGVAAPPAEHREEISSLQSSLKEARLEGEAGHVKSALARAEAALSRSKALGYLPLLAESYEALGHLYGRELRLKDAERAYEEAILAAEESGYTEYRARALVGMTQLVATGSSRYAEARRFARRAKAAIAQGGGDPDLVADIDLAIANVLTQEGQPEEALELLESSLRQYRGQRLPKVVYIARLQNHIASIRIELGQYEEAHALAQSSYEQIREELGDSHPRSAAYLSTLAVTHRIRGELREARRIDKELRAFWASDKARSLLKEDDDYSEEFRSIRGRVLGPEGQPVEGATVVCAQRAIADARFLDASWNASRDAAERYSRATTESDGGFHCREASTRDIVVVAEHEALGRSSVHFVPEGAQLQSLDLRLRATGFLTGRVTKDGEPAEPQSVSVVPVGGDLSRPPMAAVAFLREDGTYSFERLAPGRYKVFSGPRTSDASQQLRTKEVEIVSGQGATVDFDQSDGDAALSVRVAGIGGAEVPSAQVLLVPGHVESQSGKDFNESVVASGRNVHSHFWSKGKPLELRELDAGAHSLCVVPLGGDYRDPEYMGKFTKDVLDRIPVHCQDVELISGEVRTVTARVPALQPFVELEPTTQPVDSN